MTRAIGLLCSVPFVLVLTISFVSCEPPPQNSGGWGQQQSSGGYSSGYSQQQTGTYSSGYTGNAPSGGWGQQQQAQPLQSNNGGGGGWGQPQQAQVQSSNNGGWGQQQAQVQSSGNGGWQSGSGLSGQSQMKGGQQNGGWGPQLNLELDTAHLKTENLNPVQIIKAIFGIPRKIVEFIRDSGLYLLFIPLIIILPLMLLAFNFGRTLGALKHGWGWSRSFSTVEKGIIGYLKSPVWQKIGETLMNEQNFELIMKSIEEFKKKKNW